MPDAYTFGGGNTAVPVSLEERARALGVTPIDALLAKRRSLVMQAAPKRALRDTFDARRKAERGKILFLLNAERTQKGEKDIPATLAETVASGDPRYIEYLDKCQLEFAELVLLDDEIQAINDRILRARDLLRMHAAEAHIEPSSV
jgi:hypothetical protein